MYLGKLDNWGGRRCPVNKNNKACETAWGCACPPGSPQRQTHALLGLFYFSKRCYLDIINLHMGMLTCLHSYRSSIKIVSSVVYNHIVIYGYFYFRALSFNTYPIPLGFICFQLISQVTKDIFCRKWTKSV